jgi:hypothetical protein
MRMFACGLGCRLPFLANLRQKSLAKRGSFIKLFVIARAVKANPAGADQHLWFIFQTRKRLAQLTRSINTAGENELLALIGPTTARDIFTSQMHHSVAAFKFGKIKFAASLIPQNIAVARAFCCANNPPHSVASAT